METKHNHAPALRDDSLDWAYEQEVARRPRATEGLWSNPNDRGSKAHVRTRCVHLEHQASFVTPSLLSDVPLFI